MKREIFRASLLAGFLSLWQVNIVAAAESLALHSLPARQNPPGWGVEITGAGLASVRQPQPVQLEFWSAAGELTVTNASYDSFKKAGDSYVGKAVVAGPDDSLFAIEDRWRRDGSVFRLVRTVEVQGNAPGGFLSGCAVDFVTPASWPEAEWFAPGMIYGGFANLTDAAIGGRAFYEPGAFTVRIREDRMPAPLLLARFGDGTSLAVLNPAPRSDTTAADSHDTKAVPMIDERFQFGAIGGQELNGRLSIGYWFPGSEGEVTYAGDTYPGGQLHKWRRRFHPIKDGLMQRYEVAWRFGREETFPAAYNAAWRWAWATLKPALNRHDIESVRECVVKMLCEQVQTVDGRTCIDNYINATPKDPAVRSGNAIFGFTGRNLESALFLLRASYEPNSPESKKQSQQGCGIIDTFARLLKMNPPVGEGFAGLR